MKSNCAVLALLKFVSASVWMGIGCRLKGEFIMLFVQYPKCSTCKKAEKWLRSKGIFFEDRNIKEQNPTYEELEKWVQASGLELKKFFNTSGQLYKQMQLKDKLPTMTEEEKLKLLASDGMLVKRPILVRENGKVLVGFKEAEWELQISGGVDQDKEKE